MSANRIGLRRVDAAVANIVRSEMALQQIKQADVTRAIGMHPNVFGRKYRGEVAFTSSELADVGRAIGVPASDLIARAEQRMEEAA